jgi:hypothetical protein
MAPRYPKPKTIHIDKNHRLYLGKDTEPGHYLYTPHLDGSITLTTLPTLPQPPETPLPDYRTALTALHHSIRYLIDHTGPVVGPAEHRSLYDHHLAQILANTNTPTATAITHDLHQLLEQELREED